MKKLCFCLAILLCLNVVFLNTATAETCEADFVTTVATSAYNNYQDYRIPGIVATKKGTILAYWEARTQAGWDDKPTDIMIYRSTDGGNSFNEAKIIKTTDEACLSNPMMIVGNDENETIHLLYAKNLGVDGVYHCTSTDDGVSWSDPVDISACLQRNMLHWTMVNFGPGHGICLQNGENAGRLLLPMWCFYNNTYYVYTVYSDDNGATWQMGERVEGMLNETMIAELSDGGVLLNARQFGYSYNNQTQTYKPTEENAYRHLSFSSTGIDSWSDVRKDSQLPDPACQGSMISTTINGEHAILFVNCANKAGRSNLTVRCSFDDGKTWVEETVFLDSVGAYSDIAVYNGTAYVLHEDTTVTPNKTLSFTNQQGNPENRNMFGMELFSFDLEDAFGSYTTSVDDFEGSGTNTDPYLLEHMGDLNTLQNSESNYAGEYFKLCFDPDFKFDESNWNGIGSKTPFEGYFDGNGHTVNNLIGSFFLDDDNANISNISYQNQLFSDQNYYQVGNTDDFRVRFVAELMCDVSQLQAVGFEFEIIYGLQMRSYEPSCSHVYEKLLVDGTPQAPSEGKYFLAYGIMDIPEDMPVSFTVRPYATAIDGKTYYGSVMSVNFVNREGVIGLVPSNGECAYLPWNSVFS